MTNYQISISALATNRKNDTNDVVNAVAGVPPHFPGNRLHEPLTIEQSTFGQHRCRVASTANPVAVARTNTGTDNHVVTCAWHSDHFHGQFQP